MRISIRRRGLSQCLIAAFVLAPFAATGQSSWPAKPVRIVVPFAAGGSVDIVARQLAQRLTTSLGHQFVVDNKPGASGNIGTEQVVRAVPDGYTLLMIPDSNATVNPHIYPGMRFNPAKDLLPISLLSTIGVGLIVNPSLPVNNMQDYLAYAQSHPGGMSFGSPGAGTPHHLAGEMLKQMSGAKLQHIPYKGGSPAMLDVVGNQIPSAFVALAVAVPQIKAGKLKLIAVTGATRSSLFPDTPTLGESVKNFEVTSWMGLFAPVGTSAHIQAKLHDEVKKALLSPAVAQPLAEQALEVVASSPEELEQRMQVEYERWGKLIKANHITVSP